MAGAYCYIFKDRARTRNAVLCGCLAGATWLLRANGVVFLLAIFLDSVCTQFIQWRQQRRFVFDKSTWRYVFIVFLCGVGMQVVTHSLLFKRPEGGSYFDQLGDITMTDTEVNRLINLMEGK